VGMAKNERLLRVPRDPKLPGECTACGHKFTEPEMLKKFREHNCHEDSSQAALRVVRESTENK
jgi:hypothetical protein